MTSRDSQTSSNEWTTAQSRFGNPMPILKTAWTLRGGEVVEFVALPATSRAGMRGEIHTVAKRPHYSSQEQAAMENTNQKIHSLHSCGFVTFVARFFSASPRLRGSNLLIDAILRGSARN